MTAYLAGLAFLRARDHDRAADIDGISLLILAAMGSFAQELPVPECYASQASIAEQAHVGIATVGRTIPKLIKLGLIENGGKRGKTTRWLLRLLSITAIDKDAEATSIRAIDKSLSITAIDKSSELTSIRAIDKTSIRAIDNTTDSTEIASSSSRRSSAESIIAALGAKDDEIKIVLEKIKANHNPRNLAGYVRAIPKVDLQQRIADAAEERRKAGIAAAIAQLRSKPACGHGEAGGSELHPVSGKPLCAQCRAGVPVPKQRDITTAGEITAAYGQARMAAGWPPDTALLFKIHAQVQQFLAHGALGSDLMPVAKAAGSNGDNLTTAILGRATK